MEIFKNKIMIMGSILFVSIMSIVMLVTSISSSSDPSSPEAMTIFFSSPFEDGIHTGVTSDFGYRADPFDNTTKFHSGIDLSAPSGTNIVASADGIVYETGYSESGLGNYVYLEHDFDGLKYYTIYGHMLDNSIVVTKGQEVKVKEKIGVIGSTGRSTGTHLHFMICVDKLSFDNDHLIDPKYLFKGGI